MLSHNPTIPEEFEEETVDKSILRQSLESELDAVNLYEQFADSTTNENIRKVLLDIAREEKTHIGEFLTMLSEIDKEQVDELMKAKGEVKELTGIRELALDSQKRK